MLSLSVASTALIICHCLAEWGWIYFPCDAQFLIFPFIVSVSAMIKILMLIVAIYGSVLLLLFLFQRSFIYYPHKLDRGFIFPTHAVGQEEIFITCNDGCIINGLFIPGREDKPTVLIFHGNAGNITHRDFLL